MLIAIETTSTVEKKEESGEDGLTTSFQAN